jgi:hypothetical protein
MGVALFIEFEQQPDFDAFVNGKTLSRTEQELAKVAKQLRVKPLMSFFSMSSDETEDFFADEGVPAGVEVPGLQWFEASDGLRTVRALLNHLQQNANAIKDSAAVIRDLEEFARLLTEADKRELRWHLAVDY